MVINWHIVFSVVVGVESLCVVAVIVCAYLLFRGVWVKWLVHVLYLLYEVNFVSCWLNVVLVVEVVAL